MYETIDKNIFILLQINDSLFPIGAYSHSYGLETYIQKNLVNDMDSAYEYLESNLKNNFLYISVFRSALNDVWRGERAVAEVMTTERAWKRGTLRFLPIATVPVWNLSNRFNT